MAAYYTRAKARSEVEPEDLEQRDSAYIGHHFADVLPCSQSPGSVLVRLSVCLSVPTIDSSDVCRRLCCSVPVLCAADIDRHSCECRTAAAGGFAAQRPSCVQQIWTNTAAGASGQQQGTDSWRMLRLNAFIA